MMSELSDLLAGWQDLWRYPSLAAALEQAGDQVTPDAALAGLLGGIAAAHNPRGAVAELLDREDFAAADRILTLLGTAEGRPSDAEREEFERDLADARVRALDEVRGRVASITRRAKQVGTRTEPPSDIESLAARSRHVAMAALDGWEQEVAESEQAVALGFRDRLLAVEPGLDSDWTKAVLRCIDARSFAAAERLLTGGPGTVSSDTPAAVPPRRPWPYTDPLANVVAWFLRASPAPPNFYRAWGTSDPAAIRIVESLRHLISGGVTGERLGGTERKRYANVNEESVRSFAEALDLALGAAPAPRHVIPRGDGYETTLAGLVDARAPWLPRGDGGVRVWVSRLVELTAPPTADGAQPPIAFHIAAAQSLPRHRGAFDCTALFRSIGDVGRLRTHLLREIGARLEPARHGRVEITVPLTGSEGRAYIEWCLDLLALRVTGPEVADLLVFYGAGRGDLTSLLLNIVIDSLPNRQSVLTADTIVAAFRTETFLAGARQAILSPFADDPPAKAAVAAVATACGGPSSVVDLDLVRFAIEELAGCTVPPGLPRCVSLLAEQGILGRDEIGDRYTVPAAGLGPLLNVLFPETVAIETIQAACNR